MIFPSGLLGSALSRIALAYYKNKDISYLYSSYFLLCNSSKPLLLFCFLRQMWLWPKRNIKGFTRNNLNNIPNTILKQKKNGTPLDSGRTAFLPPQKKTPLRRHVP